MIVGTWPSGAERPDAGSCSAGRSRAMTVDLALRRRGDRVGQRLILARAAPSRGRSSSTRPSSSRNGTSTSKAAVPPCGRLRTSSCSSARYSPVERDRAPLVGRRRARFPAAMTSSSGDRLGVVVLRDERELLGAVGVAGELPVRQEARTRSRTRRRRRRRRSSAPPRARRSPAHDASPVGAAAASGVSGATATGKSRAAR